MHAFCDDVLCYFVLEKDRDRGEMGGVKRWGGEGGRERGGRERKRETQERLSIGILV